MTRGRRQALSWAARGLGAALELVPALRMAPTRRRRSLPNTMRAGFLGAEIATWWALSPSLLPRPWWVTAANLAVCQAVGHAVATAVHTVTPWMPRLSSPAHGAVGSITLVTVLVGMRRQRHQTDLMGIRNRGPMETAAGVAVGTAGYGVLLVLGGLFQHSVGHLRLLAARMLPSWIRWLSWPMSISLLSAGVVLLGDRVVLRRLLGHAARNAEHLNRLVFPGTSQPWEPERSGSPWSHERWGAVGSQGRAVLSGGPRRADIATVTGLDPRDVREPIRLFAGLVPGRTRAMQVDLLLREMHRTGAFRRDTIVINTSTGTGWITDWSVAATEFLTGGNCATVSMQYSYLPSALSWYRDTRAPILAARDLTDAIRTHLDMIPAPHRPSLYLAGESLGAYGTAGAYGDVTELLNKADGVILSGTPRFSDEMRSLIDSRAPGTPERLPTIDNGRHIRFVAEPDHLNHDHRGDPYPDKWEAPRMIIAQHASDPIVWWDLPLFIRRPEWLREPGTRGVKAPSAQNLDVFQRLRWVPFVTGWQLALDLAVSVDVPGGHGHNYHGEFLDYWAAVLEVPLTPAVKERAEAWIRENSVKR